MAGTFKDSIKKLRKKSRTLLARVDEDSRKVDAEVKKLRLRTLSLINCYNHENQGNNIGRNTYLWKLRNDSSGVSAVLYPDYFCTSPKHTDPSMTDIISSGKLMLTSKKPREQFSKIVPRKPVKGCYCNIDASKTYASSRTQRKPVSPCRQCRSQLELRNVRVTDDKTALSSPISCETFRRIRKIDYTPRSQFLRNVQSKICELQIDGQGDCLSTCPRSSSYHRYISSTKMQDAITQEKTMQFDYCKRVSEEQKSPVFPKASDNSIASERNESNRENVIGTSRRIRASSRKHSKSPLRKTISSKMQMPESCEESTSKSPTLVKRATRKQDYFCCCRNELAKTVRLAKDKCGQNNDSPENHVRKDQCQKYGDALVTNDSVDQEMQDLRKFREQNYFETHGSSHTLASSRSSDSLQQYLLNERLFPEPARRIHQQNLVVTMPPCATAQRKRIHYFPRHVVRQEKDICNTNYRRKRHQNCPLTGHAIDLGILKTRPPLNSLALKYQKKIV